MIADELKELKHMMTAQMRRNDLVANNLANVNSIGFKKDQIFFDVLKNTEGNQFQMKTRTDFSQGTMENTQNPLDLAISGKGFFVIETEEGEQLTRNGHFTVNQNGFLCNASGNAVVGYGGQIFLALDDHPPGAIDIFEDGRIFIDNVYVDQLKIVDLENYENLEKTSNNAFTVKNNATILELENPTVLQGNLENSNVKSIDEMISLIEIQRQFERSQKILRTIDSTMNRAANTISKV